MQSKLQALEKNTIIKTPQSNQQKPDKPASTKAPDLLFDPFETEEEYRLRIQKYGAIKAGTAKLIKEKYDIKTGKFPVEITKEQWVTNNFLFDCHDHDPYIIAKRDIARDIHQKSSEYPIFVYLDVNKKTVYTKSILIFTNRTKFEVKNILKENIPSIKRVVEPLTKMEFLYVPGGWFKIGDFFGDGEKGEKPVHDVHLYGFFISKYPVTQEQWKIVMNDNPSHFKSSFNLSKNYPVEQVSWEDTQKFIRKLNNNNPKKYTYRLPTEAEWEYAARSAGKNEKYAGGNSIEELAWYNENSNRTTHIVGRKKPNGLGLYDMSGNVWEWCEDVYQENSYTNQKVHNPVFTGNNTGSRVLRGGAWNGGARCCRAACRGWGEPSSRDSGFGFRLVYSPR